MKHKHHIIPRHAGGTDDPSNLIELTVEEHAEAHRLLYEEHGRWQDKVAWKALAGMIGKEEIIRMIQSEGGKYKPPGHSENVRKARTGTTLPEQTKNKIAKSLAGTVQSKETIAKRVAKTTGQKRPSTSAAISGGNNGSAKSVIVNGNKYETIRDAMKDTGLSRYKIHQIKE